VGVFAAGLMVGGALTAVAAWGLSGLTAPLPHWSRLTLVAALTILAVSRDAGWVRFPLPQRAKLIPRTVFHGGTFLGPLRFGIELGSGVRTYITSTLPYFLCAALVLLRPSLPIFLLAGISFGIGRALMPVGRLLSRNREAWELRLVEGSRALVRRSSWLGAATGVALLLGR
jgi:hypothetical protein